MLLYFFISHEGCSWDLFIIFFKHFSRFLLQKKQVFQWNSSFTSNLSIAFGDLRSAINPWVMIFCFFFMYDWSGENCITKSQDFSLVCLQEPVLETTLTAIHHLKGDSHEQCNHSYGFAAYKQYIWWVYGRIGRGNWKVVRSSIIKAIQRRFSENNEDYVHFSKFVESI